MNKSKNLTIALAMLTSCGLLLSACDQADSTEKNATPVAANTPSLSPGMEPQNHATPEPAAIAKTVLNMQAAYKGEVTATAKYAAFSKKAATENLPQIALLYRAISAAETIHAGNHKAVLAEAGVAVPVIKPHYAVKTTAENLHDDIGGEAYEAATMYPDFLKTAAAAHNDLASTSLNYAQKTELRHEGMYRRALAALDQHTLDKLPKAYCVCPTCGNTYESQAPARCGICLGKGEQFATITSL